MDDLDRRIVNGLQGGFPLSEREASMDPPRHRLAAKMIGTPLKARSIDGAVMRASGTMSSTVRSASTTNVTSR